MPWVKLTIDIFWLQVSSANVLLWRNCLTRRQVAWLVSSRQSLQNIGFQEKCTQIKELNLHPKQHLLFSTGYRCSNQARGTLKEKRRVIIWFWSTSCNADQLIHTIRPGEVQQNCSPNTSMQHSCPFINIINIFILICREAEIRG